MDTVGPYRAQLVGKGSISIKTTLLNRSYISILTLHNILYMLYLLANLLSGSRLKEIGVFFNNKMYKLKYNSKVIGYTPKV